MVISLVDVQSALYFILYGGLVSLIFGLRKLKLRPKWMNKKKLQNIIKIEMIKISLSNWWKGLTIFTSLLIAIFISALVSWVLTPPPDHYKYLYDNVLKQAFFLFMLALPGIVFVYINIFKRINYFEKLIIEL